MRRFLLPLSILGAWLLLFLELSSPVFVTGLASAILGAWLLHRLLRDPRLYGAAEPYRPAPLPGPVTILRRLCLLVLFLPVFIAKVLAAGANIAYLALAPSMDFWPGIVRIKGGQPDLDHTSLLAALITLTPGTLTIDYDEKGDDLYVHWIDVEAYGEADMDRRVTSGLRPWVRRLLR